MKILVLMDSGDAYFMEYTLAPTDSNEMSFAITGMWEYCPGCLAEMAEAPELYLVSHLVDPDRAFDIVSRNLEAIKELVMP